MAMWSTIKKWMYGLLVRSRLMYYILPRLLPFLAKHFIDFTKLGNHYVSDESGHKIKVTQCNGKIYPIVDVSKVLSIPHITIREDDILLCSYPKSGCHWVYEILHMMVNKHLHLTCSGKEFEGGIDVMPDILLDSLPSPRVLNSHLCYHELPIGIKEHKTKIILLVRNPKDTVVSFYNHHISGKEVYGYEGNFCDYFKLFMDGELEFGGYFDYILDWDSVMRNQCNNAIHLITYENLKNSPLETIQQVARFFNIELTDSFAVQILEACQFDKMKVKREKQNNKLEHFYRKGS